MSVQFQLSVLTSLASLTEHMMVGQPVDMSPLFRIISLGVTIIARTDATWSLCAVETGAIGPSVATSHLILLCWCCRLLHEIRVCPRPQCAS